MDDYENSFVIHNGIEDNIEHANRLQPGSIEKVNEWKCVGIQYGTALKEAEISAKLQDLETRAALDREKFEHSKLMEQREADIREKEAENAAYRDRWKVKLGLGGLGLSGLALALVFYRIYQC